MLLPTLLAASEAGTAASGCEEVGFMPREVLVTRSLDGRKRVDVHAYSKYYTF